MSRIRSDGVEIPSDATRVVLRNDARYTFLRAIYAPKGRYGTSRQRSFQLVVMLQGSARIIMADETVVLRQGEAILAQPGRRILYFFDERETSIHTSVEVVPAAMNPEQRLLLSRLRGTHLVPAAIHNLIEEGLAAPPVAGPHFHAAQILVAKACLLRFAAQVLESAATSHAAHPALSRANQLLESAPFQLKTAGEIAERCGISTSRLRQLHSLCGQESPSALLWRMKTEHAIRMIRSTGLNLGEIAAQCGFANPFHLSRRVKRLTGQSPRDLRRVTDRQNKMSI